MISSAFSTAAQLSNCTITVVAAFSAAFASAAGKLRYCRCGSGPPAPRLPSGAYFAAATTARASSAERTSGATMPSAPASSTREMYSGVLAGTRTNAGRPISRPAMQICPVASSVRLECSRST